MKTIGTIERHQIEILTVAEDQGNYGPQWRIECKFPWQRNAKYPSRLWLDQDGNPKPALGYATAEVQVQSLRDGKSGDADWDYNYKLVRLDNESTNTDQGGPQVARPSESTAYPASREEQISWAQAINCAIQVMGPCLDSTDSSDYLQTLEWWADHLYPIIRRGPPAAQPAMPVEADAPVEESVPGVTLDDILDWVKDHRVRPATVRAALNLPESAALSSRGDLAARIAEHDASLDAIMHSIQRHHSYSDVPF